MSDEKFGGEIVEEIEIEEAYMCTRCTTLRYGRATMECPACGNKDVAVVTF